MNIVFLEHGGGEYNKATSRRKDGSSWVLARREGEVRPPHRTAQKKRRSWWTRPDSFERENTLYVSRDVAVLPRRYDFARARSWLPSPEGKQFRLPCFIWTPGNLAYLFTPCFRGSPMVPCGSALLRSTPQCIIQVSRDVAVLPRRYDFARARSWLPSPEGKQFRLPCFIWTPGNLDDQGRATRPGDEDPNRARRLAENHARTASATGKATGRAGCGLARLTYGYMK